MWVDRYKIDILLVWCDVMEEEARIRMLFKRYQYLNFWVSDKELEKNKVEKKTYYKFLDLITLYTNRYNKVNFDKYKKDSKLSKTIFNDFRAELSRNAVIMKTTTTLWGFDWYMNPLISRKWSSNYTELLWLFLDKTKEIYWIDIETFL